MHNLYCIKRQVTAQQIVLLIIIQFIGLFFVWVNTSYANEPGDLDITFGNTGIVTTTNLSDGHSVAIQPDGKIVVVGIGSQPGDMNGSFGVARFNSNGSLDTSFGGTGVVTTPISNKIDQGYSVVIQNDKKIVVAGISYAPIPARFAVARYLADGNLDISFNGTGIVTAPLRASDSLVAIALQVDGKLVVTGNSFGDFAVVRYNSDGSLDTDFKGTGIVTTSIDSGWGYGQSVTIQPDNKIIIAGTGTWDGSDHDFTLLRYDQHGTLDHSFNNTGVVTTPMGGTFDIANSIALQTDGKIIAVGGSGDFSNSDFAIARYNSDGELDTTFNTTGILTTSITSNRDQASSVAIQSNGKIVVAGHSNPISSNPHIAVVRYNNDGSLDTTFNGTGIVTTSIGNHSFGESITIQQDGKIVVTGYTTDGFGNSALIAIRYIGDQSIYLPIILKGGQDSKTRTADTEWVSKIVAANSGTTARRV